MESFKEYQTLITEDTTASTYFEDVLVDCWNQGTLSKKTFYNKILEEAGVSRFLALKAAGWGTTGKSPVQQKQILWHLSKLLHKKIKLNANDTAEPAGSSKVGVSTFWTAEDSARQTRQPPPPAPQIFAPSAPASCELKMSCSIVSVVKPGVSCFLASH